MHHVPGHMCRGFFFFCIALFLYLDVHLHMMLVYKICTLTCRIDCTCTMYQVTCAKDSISFVLLFFLYLHVSLYDVSVQNMYILVDCTCTIHVLGHIHVQKIVFLLYCSFLYLDISSYYATVQNCTCTMYQLTKIKVFLFTDSC